MNCENIHAVGGLIPHAWVKYARNAVPDKMTGSCNGALNLYQYLNFYAGATALLLYLNATYIAHNPAQHKKERKKVEMQFPSRRTSFLRYPESQKP